MLDMNISTHGREVEPCQGDLFGYECNRVRHPKTAAAHARTEHLDRGYTYPCVECGVERTKRDYDTRKPRSSTGVPVYYKMCKKCNIVRATDNSAIRRKKYAALHGVTPKNVGMFSQSQGKGWRVCDQAVAEYWAHKKQQQDLRDKDRADAEIARQIKLADSKRLTERQAWADWDSQLNAGRLTLGQAWRDWLRRASPEWYCSIGLTPPASCFANDGHHYRFKYHNDPAFRLMERQRRRLTKKRKGKLFNRIDGAVYGTVHRGTIDSIVLKDCIGYSSQDLLEHITSRFSTDMSLDRLSEIHIDHIIPCDYFDMADDDEVRACWALVNLQPMWGGDNISKKTKIIPEFMTDELLGHLYANAPRVYDMVKPQIIRGVVTSEPLCQAQQHESSRS